MFTSWYRKRIVPSVIIVFLLGVSFWIRVQGVDRIPDGQFTENDGYFYYWQATLILEQGHLPARDMQRWVPLGRDIQQTLNLYPYAIAYLYKYLLSWSFPNLSLYDVSIYAPVFCFCIGLLALCVFLYQTYGILFSSVVGVILATLPGSIERSAAGFADRDAWCLMIGTLAVLTYLVSIREQSRRNKFIWTLISGLTMFLSGLSWEGFGVFFGAILIVELCRFITSDTEEGLELYFLWVLCFVPSLFIASPAYHSGYYYSQHLTAFVLMPPVVLLLLRVCRYLLLTKFSFSNRLRSHSRMIALVLMLASVMLAVGYVSIQYKTFTDTTVPMSQDPLLAEMTELRSPGYTYWVARYGSVFIVGCLGAVVIMSRIWQKQGYLMGLAFALFSVSTFFREPLDKYWGTLFGNILFGIATLICIITLIYLMYRYGERHYEVFVRVAFSVWFIGWIALARDAKRYDFFIGVVLAYFTAELIVWIGQIISQSLHQSDYVTDKFRRTFKQPILNIGTIGILLIVLMFVPPEVAHTYRSVYAAKEMRDANPGHSRVYAAYLWMKTFLVPKQTEQPVVAADWSHGSQLNVIAGVKTITDQDTFIPYWVQLYYTHIHNATSEKEVLTFLKTHHATHLMLTPKDTRKTFLHRKLSEAFKPVYPRTKFDTAKVKIWEIHYPAEIKADDKYLQTQPSK